MLKRRLPRIAVVVGLCALASSSDTTRAQPASSAAAEWLAGAARALGGDATLRSIEAVEVGGVSVWFQREQSERPEGPWAATFTDFTDVRKFDTDIVRRTSRTRGYATDWVDNAEWTAPSTILVASGVALRNANGAFAPTQMPWDLGNLPLALGPEHVVATARDAADLHAEADERLDGYLHHVLAFTYAGARVRLILNQPSLLPKAVELTRARPFDAFWTPWGDVTQRVTFGIWTIEPEGVRYPRLWSFSTGGQPDGTIEITRVRLNPKLVTADFEIVDDVRQRLIAGQRRVADIPLGNPTRTAEELAPGVMHVPGRWDVVEIKQDDGIVIVEGPLTSEYSAKVIADARKRFNGAPIKAVVTTSDSWPHIGGLREYVARSIPIYTLDLNVPILTRLFAARYTSTPDSLARRPMRPSLRVVSAKTVVGSGPNRFEVYPLRTVSGERQMMIYWPAHQLLYTSDLFTIQNSFVFLPQQVGEAVDVVARERLVVKTAFGMHYNAIPWTTVVDSATPPKRGAG